MTPAGTGEDRWVERILARLGRAHDHLVLGPGHDCAVLDVSGARVVVTSDVLVDGVHFELETCGGAAAAGKALRVNLSDLAAAGALPLAFEVGVVMPPAAARDERLRDALAEGWAEAAERYDCPCAGGDTNVADAPLTIAVTAVGRPGPSGRLLSRAGARAGDLLSVTGPLGGSRGGRHLCFEPRLDAGAVLAGEDAIHAAMDLSDGLSVDLPRLCAASAVGAVVDGHRVPVHDDVGTRDDRARLDHALHDGEDFELLVAHAALGESAHLRLRAAGVTLTAIGRLTSAAGGIRLLWADVETVLDARGYDHFTPDREPRR